MFRAFWGAVADGIDSGEPGFKKGKGCEVNEAVEGHRGHEVDE